ncbi:hypothetical protein ACXR2U_05205 [Jatrophihabitans sp. YIM 134969]
MTHPHRTFREHLVELAERGHEPEFQLVSLPPLVEFDRVFASVDWFSLDVTKSLDADGLTRTYQLTGETVAAEGDEPTPFTAAWTPTLPGQDPYDGFTLGTASVLWGGVAEVPPPDGPVTEACLLLVTTDFVHLSATRAQTPPLVRGAVEGPGDGYEYVQLAR